MAYLNSPQPTPPICPVCGEDVPPRAKACPECGADHLSGWKKDAEIGDGLDLPDEDFNYEEFIDEEFGSGRKQTRIQPFWWITAVFILIAFAVMTFVTTALF